MINVLSTLFVLRRAAMSWDAAARSSQQEAYLRKGAICLRKRTTNTVVRTISADSVVPKNPASKRYPEQTSEPVQCGDVSLRKDNPDRKKVPGHNHDQDSHIERHSETAWLSNTAPLSLSYPQKGDTLRSHCAGR